MYLSALWNGSGSACKFYGSRKLELYPADRIYEEAAFIAYYFHWSHDDIMALSNLERLRWCREISGIHDRMENTPDNPFLI